MSLYLTKKVLINYPTSAITSHLHKHHYAFSILPFPGKLEELIKMAKFSRDDFHQSINICTYTYHICMFCSVYFDGFLLHDLCQFFRSTYYLCSKVNPTLYLEAY